MSRTDNLSNLQQFPPLTAEPPETSINAPDDGLFLPPIYTSPSIITIQPSSLREENRSPRRPVPINTLDWVSTPRSQLGVFSGTYFLSSVEQLEIQQVVDLSSLLGKSKNGAQYRVRVPRAETIFLAIEDSKECQRTFLRSSRELTLNIMDPSGETSFVIRKSLSWGCMPGFLHRVSVESTNYIGSVEQNFTVLGISFTVYDHNRTPLCFIDGPNVYSCCMSTETQFQIVSVDKSRQIASLIRHWDHALVDYSVLLTFTPDTDVKLKGLLLGAAFLLEFLFFEHRGRR
ncbi:phospholipid scramblase 2 isoform X2 [Nasonia vitripennis]|uniref:Phospholipid scramblase n=1 Tax=Nasonia vitripennis TaxID=7425 RepID=A0A7M7R3E2_NASVI|nr:phospholipid scramblase 2 isoform X2 [Nasonia vitripennis]